MENQKIMINNKGIKYRALLLLLVLNLIITGGLVANEFGWFFTKVSNHEDGVLESQLQTTEKYTLYIGTNDKDTYTQLIPTNQAQDIVNEICTRYVDGYTTLVSMGGWVDETGTLTQENTLVYSFYDVEEEQIIAIMDEIIDKLNQNTILMEHGEAESMYYGGNGK